MKHLLVLAIALAAACGKEETPVTPDTPSLTVPETPAPAKPAVETPQVPSTDAAKTALEKAIADTKDLIARKEAEVKALTDKIKSNPMGAAQYQGDIDKLTKEIADLRTKLDGYVKELAAK